MHSYQTRTSYQQHVLSFLNWVRTTFGIRHLEEGDAQASLQVSADLTHRIKQG